MLNPAHIDLFRAVVRHGGITKAAVALGVGQPHVSRVMAKLEAELGFALFVRGQGHALPTQEGEAFAREVDRTYAGLDHLQRAARQIQELGVGPLRIACQPSLVSRLLPKAIRLLRDECPGSQIAVHVPSPDMIWSWVSSGQCDVGLVRPRAGYTGVVREPFLSVDAVCALPCNHVLADRQDVTIDDLVGQPLIAGAAGDFQQLVEDVFARRGITPCFSMTAQYTSARCGLVAEGLGLAIVDPVAARELAGLPIVFKPFLPRVQIDTILIRPAGAPSNLAERLIKHLAAERDSLSAKVGSPIL